MTGLVFGESPRWHADRLWCVDMGVHEVVAIDLEGKSEVVVRVPTGRPDPRRTFGLPGGSSRGSQPGGVPSSALTAGCEAAVVVREL
jgi:sugar lactone lactonase YvrE